MMTPEQDKDLVARFQAGDQGAFDLLMLKYQTRIAKLVFRLVRDPDEVQDVVQETFIKTYRALPRFRGDSEFFTWIYRIALNTAKNHLITRSRRPPASDIDVGDAEQMIPDARLKDEATPERILQRDEIQQAILDAMDQLPEHLRTAITLREYDGLSYEQIGEVMDCPVGTVRSRIFRAREAIDTLLKPMLENGQE